MVDAKPWVAPVDNGDQAESRFAGFCKMLGAVRINAMVESLQLSQQIRENVWCLFQQILDQRASLFFNHHIDQIILCCFYGVAQIYQLNLTFTKILNNYREQTQCEPQFFCVFVDWSSARCRGACEQRTGQEHVGIITFYNEIFFTSVESLLFELGRPGGATVKSDQIPEVSIKNDGHLAQCPGSPKTPPIPSQKKCLPHRV